MTQRTVVLLGAGASADAGLPLTSELAQRLVYKANANLRQASEVVQSLNFVYSQMVGHQGDDGGNPLKSVNIETLISAVRLLQNPESHEVAPFVLSWKQGAFGFGRSDSGWSRSNEVKAGVEEAAGEWGGEKLAGVIADIASDVMRPQSGEAYKVVEKMLLTGIREQLGTVRSTKYLVPLARLARSQDGGLDVITLNYDLTVEKMAKAEKLPLDTGIQRWKPGEALDFPLVDGTINLLKLHGSLDWAVEDRPGHSEFVSPSVRVVEKPSRELPWIVVGNREKLATDGPTLDLLHAAGVALSRASHLVVVGYSFADKHINSMVRDWMALDTSRTITVLDPFWPQLGSYDPRSRLAVAFGASDNLNIKPPVGVPRLHVIAKRSKEALDRALVERPRRPDPYAEAHIVMSADGPVACVTLLQGPSLRDVSVYGDGTWAMVANFFSNEKERREFRSRPAQSNSRRGGSIARMKVGETHRIPVELPVGATRIDMCLVGHTLAAERHVYLEMRVPEL